MSATLQFFYDVASPYSYFAFVRMQDVCRRQEVSVKYRPFLLGGVFRATNNQMPASNPARGRYLLKDLQRWSVVTQIPFKFSSSFPHNSLMAMRTITAAHDTDRNRIAGKIFEAAWIHDLNIGSPGVLADILGEDVALLEKSAEKSVKDELRSTTDDAVAAGAFGAPFFLVGDEGYWGNDRLEMAVNYAANAE